MPSLRPIFLIVCFLLLALAAAMLIPALADWAYGSADWEYFAVSSLLTLTIAGAGIFAARGPIGGLDVRQAFLLTALAWLSIAGFSALPFILSHLVTSYTDAFFEAISGLTTTGSTVMAGLDTMPPGILLWRSILQWIGGIGIIVMAVAILPFLRVGGMQLFRAESSDRSEKLAPRPGQVAAAISAIYLGLTAICAAAYTMTGMTRFEAINHAMTTLATGGYSTSDLSLGHFGPASQWVAATFMLAGGLPFVLYARTLLGRPQLIWRDSQVRGLVFLLAAAIGSLSGWLVIIQHHPLWQAVREACFNVISIVTTTGFAASDYSAWGGFAVVAFFVLTFVGGCTGSTAGGIKIFRFQVVAIMLRRQILTLLFPHSMLRSVYNDRRLPDDVSAGVIAFFTLFILSFGALALALTFLGLDFLTAVSGAATALANVGPGLGPIIGPAGNFAPLPDAAKWLLAAGMLLGRLEIFTVYALLLPAFWRG
jgi:trk system potassium uptake protein TrkH